MKNDDALIVLAVASMFAWPMTALAEANAPASASAADAAPRVSVVPTAAAVQAANELMRLQEETLLLKAQLKKLDAQTQVAEREEALHRMGATVSYADVSLIATQSLGKTMSATVATTDGAEFDVRPGDTLPNGMRVASIRSGAVVLVGQGAHRTMLTVSTPSTPSRQGVRNVAATGGVPPIPTLPMPTR
jgi:type IV pilus biogenesis protein PilP